MDPTPANAKPKANFALKPMTRNVLQPLPNPAKEIQPARREEPESIAMERSFFKELVEVIRKGQEQTARAIEKLAISRLGSDFSKEAHSSIIGREDIAEERFRILDLKVPQLPDEEIEKKWRISEWLGCVVPLILSHGFELFRKELIDEKGAKTYCSEMLLLAILKLAKKNGLTTEEMAYINEKALEKVLGHNILKYPQSSET